MVWYGSTGILPIEGSNVTSTSALQQNGHLIAYISQAIGPKSKALLIMRGNYSLQMEALFGARTIFH